MPIDTTSIRFPRKKSGAGLNESFPQDHNYITSVQPWEPDFENTPKAGVNVDVSKTLLTTYESSDESAASTSDENDFDPYLINQLDQKSDRAYHTAGDNHTIIINQKNAVGLEYLPFQRMNSVARKGSGYNLMVVGESGLGKSTFINTLFGSSILPTASNTKEHHLYEKRTDTITLHKSELVENNFKLKFTCIDTPGFGDFTDNSNAWIPITKYIEEQFRLYLFQEEQPDRSKLVDSRVHCCLYFLSPTGNGISPLDIIAMQELSKRVNLIPVIGKSDTFTKKDLAKFKEVVKETLTTHNIEVCNLVGDEDLDHKINTKIPFALIGSNERHKKADGKIVRGRKYRWGLAEVENEEHCDFIALREVLMSEFMLDFILSTENHYEKYREDLLNSRLKEQFKKLKNLTELKDDTPEMEEVERLKQKGFDAMKLFSKHSLLLVEKKLCEKDPIFLDQQLKIKKKFALIVANQETKFKDWKKALVDRQNVFNKDIEATHAYIVKLQDHIQCLEMDSPEY